MKRKKYILSALSAAIFVMLIVDAETASAGVSEGLELCMKVMIPSLFPFFIVSTYMNAALLGLQIPGLRYIGKLLRVPAGGESLLLLGMIGGYPVGAQLIADMYRQGILDKRTAQILLGYCSNAGPAFIFGVAGALFSALREPLFLWTIQLLSALTTGLLLPRPYCNNITAQHCNQLSITAALKTSISACVSVCGWIIVFKIVMTYISTYLAQQLSKAQMILLAGILELSNGCIICCYQFEERFRIKRTT